MHYEVRCHCGRTMGHAPRLPAGYWRCGCGNMVRVVDQQHDACHGRGSGPCGPELVVHEPIALCAVHVSALARTDAFLNDRTMQAQRVEYMVRREREQAQRRNRKDGDDEARRAHIEGRRQHMLRDQSVVYYIARGDLIKIGHTTNMVHRMSALQPDAVLATEPGGEQLERRRHQQFRHLRAPLGHEYFTSGDDLMAHIAAIVAEHGPPRMTTWPKVEVEHEPMWATVGEASHLSGVTVRTIQRWAADGRIRCLRRGRKVIRVDPAEIEELAERRHAGRLPRSQS